MHRTLIITGGSGNESKRLRDSCYQHFASSTSSEVTLEVSIAVELYYVENDKYLSLVRNVIKSCKI